MSTQPWKFETQQIHAGQTPDPTTGARALPIYQTTAFTYDSAEQARRRFALEEAGPIYTRLGNPTNDVVEARIATLEHGVGALLVASGQAATTLAVLNVAQAGDHVVASASVYGGTTNLLRHTLSRYGIETTFVTDPHDPDEWRAAVRPETRLFFGEAIPNPRVDILDIEMVAGIAHDAGVPLVVDSTVATPFLITPLTWGADIVVHSATKYLAGHGTALAGVIVDGGTFDFGAHPDRFPGFTEPDPSYEGVVYARDFGARDGAPNTSFIVKARVHLLRDLGPSLSPFNAFLLAQGLETLSLRMERHVANAQRVAEWLDARDDVVLVNYAGLPSSPFHANQLRYAPGGSGAVLSFELAGGAAAGEAFVSALTLHSHVSNIGDVRSLVIHPASTTHAQLSPEEQAVSGITPGLLRLAVGIEHIDDILADLEAGFRAAEGA
jgi:O-acetylhomoserine (thiol)-lyase